MLELGFQIDIGTITNASSYYYYYYYYFCY